MKFGRHLRTSLVREYQYQYFDYDAIKKEVRLMIVENAVDLIDKEGDY